MDIRNYEKSDKPALVELTMRVWAPVFRQMQETMSDEIYEVFVPDWRKEQLRSIDYVCDSEDVEVIVAEIEGVVVGFSSAKSRPEDFLGEVVMIGVDPEYQKQGIGTALMEASLAIIKRNGFELAMVETGGDPAHDSARKTYEKLGFENWPVARYLKRI